MSSVYLHIPFCSSKCAYCDFYSQVGSARQLAEYVELLNIQLGLLQEKIPVAPLRTIFFGGGTPSLLDATQLACLLDSLATAWGFSEDIEITLEANPGTLDQPKLAGYRQAGVNRLSLGVQSLSDQRLQLLGRGHSAAEARQAVRLARAAGFDNLSLDLIFALPGQSSANLEIELAGLLALQPEHLSVYGLSFEPGTEFAARRDAGELCEVHEQLYAEQYRLLHLGLTAAGFEHYEISNFARPGRRCRHNQIYWQRQPCLALGCGAHGFSSQGWGERYTVPTDLAAYRSRLAAGQEPSKPLERFDRQGAMAETLYLALRTADGLSQTAFIQQFGCTPEQAFPGAFSRLKPQLRLEDDHWRFDLDGWLLYDHLISAFL